MTQLEKLSLVLADGSWHTTKELVQEDGTSLFSHDSDSSKEV